MQRDLTISKTTPQNIRPFAPINWKQTRCLPQTPGFVLKRGLRPGFDLYLTDYAPQTPVTLTSNSLPTGFGWIFFISGKIRYNHESLNHEMQMETGMNRLAFQPGTSGSAQLLPGAPIRVVTLTMTRKCFRQTLAQDLELLPPCFRQATESLGRQGCFALHTNTPKIQSTLFDIVNSLARPLVPGILLEGLALELIGLHFEQFTQISKPALLPGQRDKIEAARTLLVRQMENPPSLIDLARQVGLTPNKLSSGFKVRYGTTPFAHLRDLRLDHARRLLENRQMNVTDAALIVGYDSLSHFSRAFFKAFGILPSQARSPRPI